MNTTKNRGLKVAIKPFSSKAIYLMSTSPSLCAFSCSL